MSRNTTDNDKQKHAGVILLNKQFSGSWLDEEENIAGEIIDFLKADKPNHNGDQQFVFDSPHGNCPDVYVEGETPQGKEKYSAKYLLLTGPATINDGSDKKGKPKKEAQGCKFDILYIVELKRKMHSFPAGNGWRLTWQSDGKKDKINEEKVKEKLEKILFTDVRREFCSPLKYGPPEEFSIAFTKKEIRSRMEGLINDRGLSIDKSRREKLVDCIWNACKKYSEALTNHKRILDITKDIKYNGKTLAEIHEGEPQDACALYLSYSVKRMFKADPPIPVTCANFVFQRTRGRLKEYDLAKKPDNPEYNKFNADFNKVRELVESSIEKFDNDEKSSLTLFTPAKADKAKEFHDMPQKTFLDLMGLQDYEQAFTNMLWAVLKVKNGDMMKRFCDFVRDNHKDECGKTKWKSLNDWRPKNWENCTIKVTKETSVATTDDEKTLEEGADNSKSTRKTKKGRMDVCADILNNSNQSIQRVIIENKIDSPLNGVDEDDKITQLDTYYNQWGRLSQKDPLCFVVAPTRRIDEIKREIEKNDGKKKAPEEKMGTRYFLVNYGEIAEFVEQSKDMIPPDEISTSFVDEIIRAFRAHSLPLESYYAWKVWLKTRES